MLSDATSGLKTAAGLTRSWIVIVAAPPVVMFTTQALRCLMILRNGSKAAGVWSGRPSRGSRACRCTMAAPASAAPMAASAISCGVIGMCGDIDGVWIDPVTAQVMMTLRLAAMTLSSLFSDIAVGPPFVRGERHEAAVAPDLALLQPVGAEPRPALSLGCVEDVA